MGEKLAHTSIISSARMPWYPREGDIIAEVLRSVRKKGVSRARLGETVSFVGWWE